MMYKISIIIPVFNAKEYIDSAFNSLKNQSIGFDNLEVIFVDDCSTDGCDMIIDDYSKNFNNVLAIHLDENSGGAGTPRNVGINYASADYLMFLDPDDSYTKNSCEILYEKIVQENVDIVSGTHFIPKLNDWVIHPSLWLNTLTNPRDNFQKRKMIVDEILGDGDFTLKINSINDYPSVIANFGMWTKIFKKSLIVEHNIEFPEGIAGEDSVFLYHSFLCAKGIIFINEVVYKYNNIRNEINKSQSFQLSKKSLLGRLKAYNMMFDLSQEKNIVKIFSQYLLVDKLSYFCQLLTLSDCTPLEIFDILKHANSLFKICLENNNSLNIKFINLFLLIANKRYDDALYVIKRIGTGSNNLPKQKNIKIATIMDQFTHDSYKYEFDLIDVCPDDWLDVFEKEQPDLFICESAYSGMFTDEYPNGIWRGKILTNLTNDFENRSILFSILDYCKQNDILTIFYNKEDPASFYDLKENFVDTALHFDYIFTSSEECIVEYNKKGHNNVFPLMFATQPRLFNPIESPRLHNTVVFAGTWYEKFPKRCNSMAKIFDKILDYGFDLRIYDRFYGKHFEGMEYPIEYKKYLLPAVPFSQMANVYKYSDIGLNITTVTHSKSMFARRVFELMSSFTLVFSNFSKGIYSLFEDNVIYVDVDEIDLVNRNINAIKEENLYNVLENHTCSNRFATILDAIGFDYIPELRHIILFYNENDDLNEIHNHFNSVDYYYKHLKIVSFNKIDVDNIMNDFDLTAKDNYYFCFVDLNSSKDFFKKSLLHFSYISDDFGIMYNEKYKFSFGIANEITNIVFGSKHLQKVCNNLKSNVISECCVYYI